jgi:hypothetical protein
MHPIRRILNLSVVASLLAVAACVPDVDRFFTDKQLNRLGVPRDDIAPGTLVINKDGVTRSTDSILEVAPGAQLTVTAFNAVLPGIDMSKEIDASVAMKAVDAVLPLGFDGALKLTSSVTIPQASLAGLRVTETQIKNLLTAAEGGPLKKWILDRAARNIRTYVVLQTYRAKEFSMVAARGKDITLDLGIGETRVVEKGEVKFAVKRTAKEELKISGDKYYVVAVGVAAFDVIDLGKSARLGDLGVDLSQPIPRKPVLGHGGESVAPAPLFKPITLLPASEE